MSDKDFWTEVYLHAVKECISKHCDDVDSLEKFEAKNVDIDEHFECHCGYLADMALEYCKERMKTFAEESKKDIKKKEENNRKNQESFR